MKWLLAIAAVVLLAAIAVALLLPRKGRADNAAHADDDPPHRAFIMKMDSGRFMDIPVPGTVVGFSCVDTSVSYLPTCYAMIVSR